MQADAAVTRKRLSLLQTRLSSFAVEAILLLDMKNIRYLTGFTGSDGALFVLENTAILLVDGRYTTQAKVEAANVEVYEYRNKIEGVTNVVNGAAAAVIGFEAAAMNVDTHERLKNSIPQAILKPLSEQISEIRAVKDEGETGLIRRAAGIASEALLSCMEFIRPGMSELDFALELEFKMRRSGAEQISFSTIVASGPNSSLPHATPGCRMFERGDMVMIDFGAVYGAYHSDETWTCIIAEASGRMREIYGIVKQAHDQALEAIRAGAVCREIDRIARSYIEDMGLGACFPHGTGHGVGLDIHEAPRIAVESEKILEAGMVVTVEPAVYIPGVWGIRIEDMVLVTEEGCEILTRMPKELTLLG